MAKVAIFIIFTKQTMFLFNKKSVPVIITDTQNILYLKNSINNRDYLLSPRLLRVTLRSITYLRY